MHMYNGWSTLESLQTLSYCIGVPTVGAWDLEVVASQLASA